MGSSSISNTDLKFIFRKIKSAHTKNAFNQMLFLIRILHIDII